MITAQQQPVSRRHFLGLLGALTLGTAALAACGNAATATTGGAGGEVSNGTYGGAKFTSAVTAQKVDVSAVQGALKWDKAQYTATAGDVTFVVKNPGPMQHQFGIEGNGIQYESGNLDPNTTTNLTIAGLKAGTYDVVCNVPGHKAGGMVAKLVVS
jgi:uncharacterized cupredoxin-like copper-binding protein